MTKIKHSFKREVKFLPAFDRRHKDPKKNYGIHGVELCFYLTGDKGVVQFILYTNWNLPHIDTQDWPEIIKKPMPADLGCHSPKPMYEDQFSTDDCRLLPGKTCYYDGSTLSADKAYKVLISGGSEGLWKFLEDYYKDVFVNRNE